MIKNKINHKKYIGQTRSHLKNQKGSYRKYGMQRRFSSHCSAALRGRNGCPLLCAAIRKYGKENFYIEALLYCDLKLLDSYETKFIKMYDTTNIKYGYNVALGGAIKFTPAKKKEIYEKVSRRNVETWNDPIIRQKRLDGMQKSSHLISEKLKKKWSDPDFKEKQTQINRMRWTEERRSKMSAKFRKSGFDLPPGIMEYVNPSSKKISGYRVVICICGKTYNKCFTSMKFTVEENKRSALGWLQETKNKHMIT